MKRLAWGWREWLIAAAALAAAAGLGYWGGAAASAAHYRALLGSFGLYEEKGDPYSLVAPLLGTVAPEASALGDYQGLQSQVNQEISQAQDAGGVNSISYYFRDLNNAEWIGVDQDSSYYPASLLKVPVLIAYYKEAENDPSILEEPLTYQSINGGDAFDAPSSLTPGESYTVEQLIEAMIINSDNGATLTLLSRVDPNTLNDVYANLGIESPGNDSSTYQIGARTYGLFFRVLYNATYLDAEYSQKALALLARAAYVNGLVAGVPAGTTVAHKFGEHVLTNAAGTAAVGVELSDCGVVYYPSHPYLLCVMTSTASVPTSEGIIKELSAATYQAIAEKYPSGK